MNIDKLIETVDQKIPTFDTKFFNKIKHNLIKLKESGIQTVNQITSDPYLLEAIKLYLIKYFDDYQFYLTRDIDQNTKPDNVTYRQIKLSKNARVNLFKQIMVLEKNDINLFTLSSASLSQRFKFLDVDEFYLYIIKKPQTLVTSDMKSIDLLTSYPIISDKILVIFLGIETFNFLEHQNMDRFLEFFTSPDKGHKESVSNFKTLFKLSRSIEPEVRDRIILFSGIILHVLGANYTKDVDIIYYSQNDSKNHIDMIKKFSEKHDESFDFKIYTDQSQNVQNTVEIMVDPEQYFYFIGMKFMSVSQLMQRCYMRSGSAAYVDLILLNKFNHYPIDLCLPPIVTIYDKLVVYDSTERTKLIDEVISKMKRWFGIDLKASELQRMITRCSNFDHPSMIIDQGIDKFTHFIAKYLLFSSKEILYRYVTGESVLDVDSNRSRNLLLYPKLGIKKVTVVEDSDYMIRRINKLICNSKDEMGEMKVDVINGHIDSLIKEDKIVERYDNIILRNVIDKIDKIALDVDSFVTELLKISHKGTVVVVICMDKQRIKDLLKNNTRYQMHENSQLKFGIYDFQDYGENQGDMIYGLEGKDDVVIYGKQILGYDKGSVQRLIDIDSLKRSFKNQRYELISSHHIDEITGTDVFEQIKMEMTDDQRVICRLFDALIFKKL